MAEVMEQLDAARDELLDDDDVLLGRVKDVKDVAKHLPQAPPAQHMAFDSIFQLFMCAPKDKLCQWRVVYCSTYWYVLVCT